MNIKDWQKAGEIASKALMYGKSLIKPGAKAEYVVDEIEKKIIELGGNIAFPAQVSVNSIAAHYCPDKDDTLIFSEEHIICLDVGAAFNGAIGDNALTIDLTGKNESLVNASKEALLNVSKALRPGIKLMELGEIIQQSIESKGFRPVVNLSGHGLDLYQIHTSPSIPNFNNKDNTTLKAGQLIAIEPFASSGAGVIAEQGKPTVFMQIAKKPVRSPFTREVLRKIESYNGLPFALRWLKSYFPEFKVNFAIRELLNLSIIRAYPPLVDKNKGLVSQAEHSFLITEQGSEILTRFNEF